LKLAGCELGLCHIVEVDACVSRGGPTSLKLAGCELELAHIVEVGL